MRFLRLLQVAVIAAFLPITATAGPKAVSLGPMEHTQAQVVVVGSDGTQATYNSQELEAFPNYSLQTTTPWRDEPAEFEGILLRDLLQAHGLAEVDAIRVTAENDFIAEVPRVIWETVDVMVATRVDGQPHTRRNRGPIQFVIDMDAFQASDVANDSHLVWMVARIEAAK